MQEMEYLVVNCLGDENVTKALNDKTAKVPPWELHSIIPAGVQTHEHPLNPSRKVAIMAFLVVFHRPHIPDRIEA